MDVEGMVAWLVGQGLEPAEAAALATSSDALERWAEDGEVELAAFMAALEREQQEPKTTPSQTS